jgi:hypothetical protein
MTAQAPDSVMYEGAEWVLVGIDGHGLFDPAAWDLRPIALSTAEWRGFVCRYAVEGDRLRLAHLSIGLADEDAGARLEELPGVSRVVADRVRWTVDFDGVDIPFTGTLMLGRGFIRDLYVHMGFHPPWKWERVTRLELDAGRVTETADESTRMAREREARKGAPLAPGPDADRQTVGRWIRDTFDRSIRRFRREGEPPGRKEPPHVN